mmetsp:Transcript_13982/g.27948  ORF Transcript_13982/g.27948 Transcript_13982/m.27948 type:complete len:85 (-) Transcript_13982:39-293(-)
MRQPSDKQTNKYGISKAADRCAVDSLSKQTIIRYRLKPFRRHACMQAKFLHCRNSMIDIMVADNDRRKRGDFMIEFICKETRPS